MGSSETDFCDLLDEFVHLASTDFFRKKKQLHVLFESPIFIYYFIIFSSLSKLLTIDGLEKQIYIGTDIPIQAGNLSYSLQPLIFDIVEDLQYLLEG